MTLQCLLTFLGIRLKLLPEQLQARNLTLDLFNFFDQQISHMLAWRTAEKFQFHQFSDLVQRKAERLAFFNEFDALEVIGCVDAVPAGSALWRRQQPTTLVIPNRLRLNADSVGEITGAKNTFLHILSVKS